MAAKLFGLGKIKKSVNIVNHVHEIHEEAPFYMLHNKR